MINSVVLTGRIGKDLELRKTQNSTSVLSFCLAVDMGYGDKKVTHWINCVAWRSTAEFLSKYAHKGDMVALSGSLQTRTWEEKGEKKYSTEVLVNEVQLMSFKKEEKKEEKKDTRRATETYSDPDSLFANTPSLDISSDNLPFY